MTEESNLGDAHPQTASFHFLFPKPTPQTSSNCRLEAHFKELWDQKFSEMSHTFIDLSAKPPNFDHRQAERGGNDYACAICAHFGRADEDTNDISMVLGHIPYPNKNGEFVLQGNRYIFPVYLRTSKQYNKIKEKLLGKDLKSAHDTASDTKDPDQREDERKTENLHIVLLHKLIEHRYIRRLKWVFETIDSNSLDGDVRSLRMSLRGWLGSGNNTLIHSFIYRYGQLVDKESPLNRIFQRKELTFYGLGGEHPDSARGFHIRDVDDNDIYRICPVVTPQGHKVGMRIFLARRAVIDPEQGSILDPDPPEPGDSLSDAASIIPFIEHDDVSRALMGANMMKQALPLEHPDVPLIQTGWEKELGKFSEIPEDLKINGVLSLGKNLLTAYLPWGLETYEDGIVISESAAKAMTSNVEKTFWFDQEKKTWLEGDYRITHLTRSNPRVSEKNKRCLDNDGIVEVGTYVKPGDVLVSAVIKRYNDVNKTKSLDVMISDEFIKAILDRDPLEVRDVSLRTPNNFKGFVTKIIDLKDSSTVVLPSTISRRIGVKVQRKETAKIGDKIASRHGAKGVVVNIIPDAEMPYLKTDVPICGDDRCSVKSPHRHVQVILNPMGVTGRLNLGQLYETSLAKVAESQGKPIVVKPFVNEWNLDQLSNALSNLGFPEDGKEQLYTVEEGNEQPLRYRSLVGPQYFLKLYHQADGKIQGRGSGQPYDYTFRDGQPRPGKRVRGDQILGGGQRIGEMETWALVGHAAWNLLDDLLNVKSDDRRLQKRIGDQNFPWNESRRPRAFVNLILLCRSLGLDLKLLRSGEDVTDSFIENSEGTLFDNVSISFAKNDQIKHWGRGGEVKSVNLYAQKKQDRVPPLDKLYPDPEGLLSREIFDLRKPYRMGLIVLAKPILNPLMMEFKGEYNPDEYMLSCIPVLPISFRNERLGFYKNFQDDLNILYRYVIRQNTRLRDLVEEEGIDQEIIDKAHQRLSTAVTYLFLGGYKKYVDGKFQRWVKNIVDGKSRRCIKDVIEGKKGLIRGHLAGKRADYSGRAVIIGDPTVPLNEAGIPDTIWNQLFPGIEKNEKPMVLLNRQPSLHRYSIQGFRASWHQRGDVIRLNPFICKPFNADYDGDTISVHIPIKPDAITESARLLPTNNLLSQANGKMVLGFDKDIALGAAYLTYHFEIESDETVPFTSEKEFPIDARNYWEKVTINGIETTVGRLLMRRLFGKVSIKNRSIDQDLWMAALEQLMKIAARKDPSIIEHFTLGLSQMFDLILKESGLSLSLRDFKTFSETSKSTNVCMLKLMRQIGKYGKELELQITKMRGPMRRPGRVDIPTDPVKSNLIDGHSEDDYFLTAHGARAGLVDKGLITAHSGHLLRDWIYRLQHLYIVQKDCGAPEGLDAENFDADQILDSRFDLKGMLIQHIDNGLQFRSPYTCTAKDSHGTFGICQKCYGYDPATGNLPVIGLPVGILAAQALGERISQETLKSFHTGGIAEKEKKGLELVKYLRKKFSDTKTIKRTSTAAKKLKDVFEQFSSGSRPDLIHFEVILRGYKSDENNNDLLDQMAKSQTMSKIVDMAIKNRMDDLHGAIGRIISGQMVDTGPKGVIDG